ILAVFWLGRDRMRGQNLLRKFLLTRESPTIDGKPVAPPRAASVHGYVGFESTTEANVLAGLENVKKHGIPFDTWWIDAGWFTCGSNWARHVGNLDPDPARFPHGLKPIADAAHQAAMKFLVWFEPERVMPDTQVFKQHSQWLLRPSADMPKELTYQIKDGFHLLDLGNPDALAWIKARLSATITSVGIDCYRNDFNMYPLYYWRNQEAADRRGMREIRYITGLYDLFDSLRKEHPRLLLDNCASGGRRIDLEMLRRALVLTRSDYLWDPIGQQCHTYALAQWIPLTGIGAASLDRYSCRSGLGSHYTLAADYRSADPATWKAIGQAVAEEQALQPLCRGDFYPLGAYSTEPSVWMAWQYHRADLGAGLVQAFRRKRSPDTFAVYHLRGLDADAHYTLKNLDHAQVRETTGRKLMQEGLIITLPNSPDAAVITYKKAG
ncbi:MAG: alpha-galactosidase, partial [Isosphaeraceae bacterium]